MCVFFTAVQIGKFRFVFPTLLVVCNDVAAYGCGRTVGRTPLFRLSPNKTLEGFVGAGILTLCCGFLMQDDPYHGIILAIYASCAAPFGGFLASAIKRASGIKDFDQLIPGHGGMTDRMDCQLLMGAFTFAYRHSLSC
ncbi:phosphatidate cytidylyltransferase [Zychaea mexicana]|uniref:phosphatidate cytidylyltransferase n=1 Tax=Zychaea mexicana TaxID=64656 RepID=UPI0022FE6155|nr:phosphatidate cytidylyltransferase [Zychaea mexicana]KAI9490871.1 phosphatidate cytidylyltransferase [Zychaea mexicana]